MAIVTLCMIYVKFVESRNAVESTFVTLAWLKISEKCLKLCNRYYWKIDYGIKDSIVNYGYGQRECTYIIVTMKVF